VTSSLATLELRLDRRDSPSKLDSICVGSCVPSAGVHRGGSCRRRVRRIGFRGGSGSGTGTALCFGLHVLATVSGFLTLRLSFCILVSSSRFRALELKCVMQDLHLIASANHFSSFNFPSFKSHSTALLTTYKYKQPQFCAPCPSTPPNISATQPRSMTITHPHFKLATTAARQFDSKLRSGFP
jgi:hypothetical protein